MKNLLMIFSAVVKTFILGVGLFLITSATPPVENQAVDWMTQLPREPIPIKAWPGGKKVAVCFVLYVEEWGFGQGPTFRPDMIGRTPDFVNEAFRQYAINMGIIRVGKIFNEQRLPLSIALNALFLEKHPEVWKTFRDIAPKAPIIAHGINNTTELLPFDDGQKGQEKYIRRTLDLIKQKTGIRSRGWSSPSVYANADTFSASTAEGIIYSLDGMDTDYLSRIMTKSGPLILIPYPTVTVDMGQYFQRLKQPREIGDLWIDYVSELAKEAELDPNAEATVVAIGLHPFVVGTPDGAAAMRRVLENLSKQKLVWITDVQAVLDVVYGSDTR